jgi:CcmD family protein
MDNLGFIVVGYTLTWVVLLGYAWRLGRRLNAASRAITAWKDRDGTGAGA